MSPVYQDQRAKGINQDNRKGKTSKRVGQLSPIAYLLGIP